MDIVAVLALIVGAYGAGLSTYLAIREARKDARKVAIDVIPHLEGQFHKLIVTNIGHRPVTIKKVRFATPIRSTSGGTEWHEHWNVTILHEASQGRLPITLAPDSEPIHFQLSGVTSALIRQDGRENPFEIYLDDAEDKVYKRRFNTESR